MKKCLLLFLLAATGTAAHAQITTDQIAAVKTLLTSQTWKTQSTFINGFTPAAFEKANNIKNTDLFPAGDRFIFKADGTYTRVKTVGGSTSGIWEVNQLGQLVFNPGLNGGASFGLNKADANGFGGRTTKRLGMCNVTSLYEVSWVPAQ